MKPALYCSLLGPYLTSGWSLLILYSYWSNQYDSNRKYLFNWWYLSGTCVVPPPFATFKLLQHCKVQFNKSSYFKNVFKISFLTNKNGAYNDVSDNVMGAVPWDTLPDEIWTFILSKSSIQTLIQTQNVNRRFESLVQSRVFQSILRLKVFLTTFIWYSSSEFSAKMAKKSKMFDWECKFAGKSYRNDIIPWSLFVKPDSSRSLFSKIFYTKKTQ